MSKVICNECETVAHCMKNGCIPKQPAPVAKPHEQEPVAKDNSNYRLDPPGLDPLYTSPPAQRQPLTDEQMREVLRTCQSDAVELLRSRWLYVKEFAGAIEAAHGIKENT